MAQPVAVLGLGRFGTTHLENLQRLQDERLVELVATHDILPYSETVAGSRGQLTHVKKTFHKGADSFWRSVEREGAAVHIVTNTPFHFEHAKRALEHTGSVLMETPTCFSLAETVALADLVAQKKAYVATTHLLRSSEAFRHALRRPNLLVDNSLSVGYWKNRTMDTRPGAGNIRDQTIHPLDLMLHALQYKGMTLPPVDELVFSTFRREHDVHPYGNVEAQRRMYGQLVADLGAEVAEAEYGTWEQFRDIDGALYFETEIGGVAVTFDCSFVETERPFQRSIKFGLNPSHLVSYDQRNRGERAQDWYTRVDTSSGEGSILENIAFPSETRLAHQLRQFHAGIERGSIHPELATMEQVVYLGELKNRLLVEENST